MAEKSPYQIIKHRHITEKAQVLQNLKNAKSNPSVARCNSPKYVFIVDKNANKRAIAKAIEDIYKDQNVKVVAVNTITVKAKPRRVRGRMGVKPGFKKAVVTFAPEDNLDNV